MTTSDIQEFLRRCPPRLYPAIAEWITLQVRMADPEWTCPGTKPAGPRNVRPYCMEGCDQCDRHVVLHARAEEILYRELV